MIKVYIAQQIWCSNEDVSIMYEKIYSAYIPSSKLHCNELKNQQWKRNKYLVANNSANLSEGRVRIVLCNLRSHFTRIQNIARN